MLELGTPILSCHRIEGSREIALRLRELSVLPPLKANGKVLLSSNNLLLKMREKSTEINTQEQKGTKENPERKRKLDPAENILSLSENIEQRVTESAAINGASHVPAVSQDMQLMLTVMREGFDNLSRTLSATSTSTANAIAEAFETFKGELEIGNEDESEQESEQESAGTQDHESLGEPPAKKRCEQQSENSNDEKSGKSPDFGALIDRAPHSSNEGKSEILNSLKQDLLKEETSAEVDSELASIINSMLKNGLPEEKLQDKLSKYHRPKNCENLTKVRVNQGVWDNLSPAVRSQDVKLQKVQTSLFKGLCALTSAINKCLGNIMSIPSGNEIRQEITDAFALIANANLELNQRRRELMKPDLHTD